MIRLFFIAFLLFAVPAFAQDIKPATGLAMYDQPKYGPGFTHFGYVNPDAPKGGTLRLAAVDTYNGFNPFILKGQPAEGSIGLIYASLLEQSGDEPFSEYTGLAQSFEMPADRSWIVFMIRPQAKWADGQPVTAEDVKWSYDTLMKDGSPIFAAEYSDVASVDVLSPSRVKFTFKKNANLQMPLIAGQLPILPKHYWTAPGHDFTQTSYEPPLGDGPYKVASVDAGRSVTYERVKNWWGENLPAYKGRYNFDHITVTYFRDANVELEGLFGNAYDFRLENSAKNWATAYNAPPVQDGRIVKQRIPNGLPQGMQAFVFNLRKPIFQDQAVRKAIDLAFDFEWSNKQLAYNAYTRNSSFFENSPMAAPHHPPEGKVRDILMQFKDQLPGDVFTTRYEPPKSDASGPDRDNLRLAIKLLDDAGYKVGPDRIRIDPKTGKPLTFEFLTDAENVMMDRWVIAFIANLQKIGVQATFRAVDESQWENRMIHYDFDMAVTTFTQSLSPGDEQRDYWESDRADAPGSKNFIGLKSPVVDKLVEMIVSAPTEADLIARCQALDYVLLDGNYVVPNWNIPAWRITYWNHFGVPKVQAPYSLGDVDTWWTK
jgi:microcin C transport system substrate-binding protein